MIGTGVTSRLSRAWLALCALCVVGASTGAVVFAQSSKPAENQQFSLEISPSPLILTLKPGETRTAEMQVRNTGNGSENLKFGLRAFSVNDQGDINLKDNEPQDVKDWVSFASPTFSVLPGEISTQKIEFKIPQSAGFTYAFAITISRVDQPQAVPGRQAILASVADFALLTIDKPGATRGFEVVQFKSAKRMYEYLPADLSVLIKNNGNTIVQPAGNVFIEKGNSNSPLAVLPLNAKGSYILPDSGRTINLAWRDGFPVYVSEKTADNAPSKRKLQWDWGKAQQFRFGKYTAKVVAIYNDGQRDVPVRAEISFWVFPWKLLLAGLVILALIITGAVVIVRRFIKVGRRVHKARHHIE